MTKKNKQITLGVLAAVAAVATPIATVVSCGGKKTETPKRKKHVVAPVYNPLTVAQQNDIIKQADKDSSPIIDSKKINIVSLGDSVAAGYTQLDGKDHRGHLDPKTNKVSGISYGSYLARALKAHGKLADYDNFAIGGSTTTTLRNLINPSFPLNAADKTLRDTITAKLVTAQSGETARFKTIKEKLKKADLVTISIGANDILGNIKLGGLTIQQLLTQGIDNLKITGGINSLVTYDDDAFKASLAKAKENLVATIAQIKKINPNAKISIIGYPMPVTQLASVLKMAKGKDGKPIAETILGAVDSIGTSVAQKYQTIDFIDAYTPETWDFHALALAPELIDIHPGARGYRVIAATILANLEKEVKYTGKGEFKPFVKSVNKKRLNVDYSKEINKYVDLKATLSSEAAAIESLAKPYKLIHFTAKLLPKVLEVLKNTLGSILPKTTSNSPAVPLAINSNVHPISSPTVAAESNYAPAPAAFDPMALMKTLIPFVEQILSSGEAGLKAPNKVISSGTEQDIMYIMSSLVQTATDLMPSIAPLIMGLVIAPAVKKLNLTETKKFLIANYPKIQAEATRKTVIAKGPANDYTQI